MSTLTAIVSLSLVALDVIYIIMSARAELRLIRRDFAANEACKPLPDHIRRRSGLLVYDDGNRRYPKADPVIVELHRLRYEIDRHAAQ